MTFLGHTKWMKTQYVCVVLFASTLNRGGRIIPLGSVVESTQRIVQICETVTGACVQGVGHGPGWGCRETGV